MEGKVKMKIEMKMKMDKDKRETRYEFVKYKGAANKG